MTDSVNGAGNLFRTYGNVGTLTPTNAVGTYRSLGNQGLGQYGADSFITVPIRDNGQTLQFYAEVFTEGGVLCWVRLESRPGRVSAATAHAIAVAEDALIKATPGTAG